MPTEQVKRALLKAALGHVPFDGWSARALSAAARDVDLSEAEARIAFPGGAAELLDFYAREGDRRMEAAIAKRDLEAMRIRERIATAVRLRIEPQSAKREAARRALALAATPAYAVWSARALYRTVDAIWYAIGDTSTDHNFYTKRVLLAGVYSSTVLFWLNDESDDAADTWAFLDRRIEDVMRVQKARGRLEAVLDRLPSGGACARGWRPAASVRLAHGLISFATASPLGLR